MKFIYVEFSLILTLIDVSYILEKILWHKPTFKLNTNQNIHHRWGLKTELIHKKTQMCYINIPLVLICMAIVSKEV